METRKLQLVGGGTSYAVSLPKHWVEGNGLRAGADIGIELSEGELRLTVGGARPRPRGRRLLVRSTDPDEVTRAILALYVGGFDTATLEFAADNAQAVRTAAGEACAMLPGLQVVEEQAGRILLQDLSVMAGFSVDKGLRRMQVLVAQMLRNVPRVVANGQDAVVRETERHEAEVDRLFLLMMKHHAALAVQGNTTLSPSLGPAAGLHAMYVAQFLERIGDYAVRMAGNVRGAASEPGLDAAVADVQAAMEKLIAIVNDATNAFHARDVPLANAAIRASLAFSPGERREAYFDAFTSPRSTPQLYSCVRCIKFFNVLEGMERVALYAKSIAEAAIDCALASAEDAPV